MLFGPSLTTAERDRYRRKCAFTLSEAAVFELRCRGESLVAISQVLNISESTVGRRVRAIKDKIEKVDAGMG